MASSKEYLDFILEQLSDLSNISYRAMMGEYLIYYRGKLIGGIYDDRFLVKPTISAKSMMPHAEMELPYEGAHRMLLVDNVDNRAFRYVESFMKMFYLIFGQAYSRNYLDVDTYNNLCVNKNTKIHMPKLKTEDDTDIVAFSKEELAILDDYFKGTSYEQFSSIIYCCSNGFCRDFSVFPVGL